MGLVLLSAAISSVVQLGDDIRSEMYEISCVGLEPQLTSRRFSALIFQGLSLLAQLAAFETQHVLFDPVGAGDRFAIP